MNNDFFTASDIEFEHCPYRHVDVDLYYRMGEREKAQEIARQLRPIVVSIDRPFTDEDIEQLRERFEVER